MSTTKLFPLLILCFLSQFTFAQTYNTAMGIRFGTEIGLTLQQRVAKKVTVEAVLQNQIKSDQTSLTLLLEKHNNFIGKRFNFFLGAGPHRTWYKDADSIGLTATGITGVAGAEMTIGRLNLSWDYRPKVNVWGGEKSFDSNTAISLRYVLVKKKKKPINLKFWEKTDKQKKQKAKAKAKRKKQQGKK